MKNTLQTSHALTRGTGLLESFLAKKRAKQAEKFITKKQRKGRILDIGCGSYPFFLSTTIFKEKFGVDGVVNYENGKNEKIQLKKLDIEKEKLPFKNGYFDVVVMLAVFEHISVDRIPFMLKEIHRVLKKNGVIIITTPAPWSDFLLHFLSRIGLLSKEEIHDHKNSFSLLIIASYFVKAGFDEKMINKGYFEACLNMWLVAKK